MKNFYDATVIKPNLTIDIELSLTPIGSLPCLVQINNNTVFEDMLSSITVITEQVKLTEPVDISIQVYRQHPDAVKLTLFIDGHEILPLYQHMANPPTDYIDFNQIWELKIPNFYSWYHTVSGQGWTA